jgi:hypothetical protein
MARCACEDQPHAENPVGFGLLVVAGIAAGFWFLTRKKKPASTSAFALQPAPFQTQLPTAPTPLQTPAPSVTASPSPLQPPPSTTAPAQEVLPPIPSIALPPPLSTQQTAPVLTPAQQELAAQAAAASAAAYQASMQAASTTTKNASNWTTREGTNGPLTQAPDIATYLYNEYYVCMYPGCDLTTAVELRNTLFDNGSGKYTAYLQDIQNKIMGV